LGPAIFFSVLLYTIVFGIGALISGILGWNLFVKKLKYTYQRLLAIVCISLVGAIFFTYVLSSLFLNKIEIVRVHTVGQKAGP
jgi:hypothetical protein